MAVTESRRAVGREARLGSINCRAQHLGLKAGRIPVPRKPATALRTREQQQGEEVAGTATFGASFGVPDSALIQPER